MVKSALKFHEYHVDFNCAGSKFLETVLKPLYFEVPTSFPASQFTGIFAL
jgi:hypothetical protein